MDERAVDPDAVKRKLWIDYQYANTDRPNELIACAHELLMSLMDSGTNPRRIAQEVARCIHDKMRIKEVTVGLKDPADGRYRYEAMAGLKETTWSAHRTISYTYDEFNDPKLYRAKQISRFTKLFLSEDNPYADTELMTYNKPVMLEMSRKALDDSIEGDYIDIGVYGEKDELVGWIEISGTLTGKLPDITTIKVIELIASIVGIAVVRDTEWKRLHAM